MIKQAYKYVHWSLWRRLMFFELKITNILKSSRWVLEKSGLSRNGFFKAEGAFSVELLAYQVSIVCPAYWQDSSTYLLDLILG